MLKSLAAGLLIAVTLSACQANRPPAPLANTPAVPKAAAITPDKPVTPPPEEEKPVIIPSPKILIGQTTSEIRAIFGTPDLLRKEAPAEIWQYLTDKCALHLFFYPAKVAAEGKKHLEISYYEVNSRLYPAVKKADAKKCFARQLLEIEARAKSTASG